MSVFQIHRCNMTEIDKQIIEYMAAPSALQKLLPVQRVLTGKIITGYNPTITITIKPQTLSDIRIAMDEIGDWLEEKRKSVHMISKFEASNLDRDAIDG